MRLFDEQPKIRQTILSDGPMPYREAKARFEKEYLEELLRWAGGNVKKAAKRAGRDRKGLYILMTKHNIDPDLYRKARGS